MRDTYREYVPHAALRPFVDRLWVRCDPPTGGSPIHILPDGCTDILIDLLGHRPPVLVGAMTAAAVFVPSGESRVLGIRFRPGGAPAFLRSEIADLTDRDATLADLGLSNILPSELGAESIPQTLTRVEAALLRRLPCITAQHRRVRHVVRALVTEQTTIDTLARDLAWSRQHLRRTVIAATGLSPKQLANVARMMRAATSLQREPHRALADIAVTAGYFDQAHMTTDLRRLALATPRQLRESTGSIFPIPSLYEEA